MRTLNELAAISFPAKLTYLANSRDPKAIPLLRQALSSADYFIQMHAALGLRELQDKASIPLIIEACQRAPADAAAAIARFSLAYFDDPQAQEAAKEFPVVPSRRERK
jgi:HEAT repeat protein